MKDPVLSRLRHELKLEPAAPRPAVVSASKPPAAPELNDDELFALATRGARPLATDAAPPVRAKRPPKPSALTLLKRARAEGGNEREDQALSDTVALQQGIGPEAFLLFKRSGVQDKQIQKLQSGQLPWRAAVDLHGCTLEQAREAVLQLMDEVTRDGVQVAKIVHGKGHVNGQALIKTAVNGWLRQLHPVLAFVSAPPREGGTGAVLVLLRRPRKNDDDVDQSARMPPM